MIEYDFHGVKTERAIEIVEGIVSQVRQSNCIKSFVFIVGHGIIRSKLMELLQNYNLNPEYKIGNNGAIVVLVE